MITELNQTYSHQHIQKLIKHNIYIFNFVTISLTHLGLNSTKH